MGTAGRRRESGQMVSSSACLQVSAQGRWHKVARTQLCLEFKKKRKKQVPSAGGSDVNEIQSFGSRESHETGKARFRHREL